MKSLLRVAWAFLKRDAQAMRPWRWLVEWLDASLSVVLWYFVARFFWVSPISSLIGQGDYFTFSLIGLALTQYVWRGFATFSNRVKTEQRGGSLELLWMSRYPLPLLILLASVWDFIAASVNAGIILVVGTYAFGASLRWEGILALMGIGLLTSVAMGSLGLLASSWFIAWGRGDVFRPLLNKTIPVLSGSFFPISLFPVWLQAVAWCLPLTPAVVLARSLLMPTQGGFAHSALWILMGLSCLLACAGWGSLKLALRCARTNGRIAAA
jgi:ABC-2 type transport system permease protein